MCGILGISSYGSHINKESFSKALDAIAHRGPDGSATWQDDKVLFGHRRLSIIDLSTAADQPFASASGKAVIIFNGEIYNYKEISKGLTLRTTSDTEVILEGYLEHGISFFKQLRGIYAFAIYDFRETGNAQLLLLRDPAGIKPMYTFSEGNAFGFSSEIKALLPLLKNKPDINEEAIRSYIHLGYFCEPQTVYRNITAAEPGMLNIFHYKTGSWTRTENLRYRFDQNNGYSTEENLKLSAQALGVATERNLVADVEVNVALSGGIDSSLIYALANRSKPTRGLTVKMDERDFDESETAEVYAKHLNAPQQIIGTTVDNKLDLLNKLLLHFDQPYADSSFIPFYFLTKAAAQHSKVLIGGDSGDEIHNGYSGYRFLPWLLRIQRNVLLRAIATGALGLAQKLDKKRVRGYRKLRNVFSRSTSAEALFEWHSWFPVSKNAYKLYPFKYDTAQVADVFKSGEKNIERLVSENYFTKRMISDYLRKSDMMSMCNSLEFRVPMLDEDLVAFSLGIPYYQKSGFFKGQKLLLREMHRQIFPPYTSAKKKKGFTIPLDTWLGTENLALIKSYILKENGIVNRFIKPEYIDQLFDTLTNKELQQYCSRESAYQRILVLYALQLWYLEQYLQLNSRNAS